jgi:alpha-glucosidase
VTGLDWWRDAVIYQIYPRSFKDTDGDGIGDLPGIIARLDYLAGSPGSLGVDAIWLSPFYPSPLADFGYDVADYTSVDPRLGTLDDFRSLIKEAHARDLRVILDWVPNHTSDQHPWFLDARASRSSERRDWYVWRPSRVDGQPPNNWMADFAEVGPAWSFDDHTQEWYLHSFTPHQPDLDWDNPDVRAAMYETLEFWLDLGVDGFRIDVVNKLGKDPTLGDNPEPIVGPGLPSHGRRHDEDWDSTFGRLREINELIKTRGDRMTVGEVYVMSLERLAEYVGPDRLDLAHNFVFMNLPWQADVFRDTIAETDRRFGAEWPAWCLGNHDHSRPASRFGGEDQARAAALLLLTLRGTPFIYQGDELGLTDLEIADGRRLDVAGRDRCRGPQPWSPPTTDDPGGGFTTGSPWLPLPVDAVTRNVRTQVSDPDSMFHLHRHLVALRREHIALRRGGFEALDLDGQLLGFLRTHGADRLASFINFDRQPVELDCAAADLHGSAEVIASSRGPVGVIRRIDLCRLRVESHEAILVRLPDGTS